jgi:hypothetical protein
MLAAYHRLRSSTFGEELRTRLTTFAIRQLTDYYGLDTHNTRDYATPMLL